MSQLVEQTTLDLRVLSSTSKLGMEPTSKRRRRRRNYIWGKCKLNVGRWGINQL